MFEFVGDSIRIVGVLAYWREALYSLVGSIYNYFSIQASPYNIVISVEY